MTYEIGQHPGATWRRIDIQCHTPRDRDWRGSSDLPGGDEAQEAARHGWAQDFVQAAVGKGLTLVAITDHHDVAFIPYVLRAARALPEGAELVVLPGIEITCRDAVQCLCLFDPNSAEDHWHRLLSKLPNVRVAPADEAKTAVVQECGLTVDALFKAVGEDAVLSETVVLIPHFGNEAAHKSLNDAGFASRAKALPCDGVYIECHHAELDQITLDKIQGRIEQWGTRRRAILATGDNKRESWDRLGAHECWIKLGETTVEAIRQAFLADEARITYAAPETPSERIVEIEVQSTLTGQRPLRVTFNDGFTALIGGRGSGKSSVLEYLRFGLGKAEADITSEETTGRRRREREAKLIDDTLKGGWVRIVLEREGVRETWFRTGDKPEEIIVTLPDETEERITVAAAQQRFPARAFHQKELSTTMLDPEAAADNITGIAAAEVIEERRRIDQEIVNAKRAVTTALLEIATHWQAELELSQSKSTVEDLKRRHAALSSRLQEGGVQAEDLEILADAPRYGRAQNFLGEVERQIAEDRHRFSSAIPAALLIDSARYAVAMTFPEIEALNGQVAAAREKVADSIRSALATLDELDQARAEASAAFSEGAQQFQARYEQAKERQAAHSTLIADSERLSTQLKQATATEDQSAAAAAASRPAVERFSTARRKLADLVEERHVLLRRAADEVEEKSNGALKARAKRDRKPTEYIDALCDLFEGSRFREAEQHCAEWVAAALQEDGPGWVTVCDALIAIYRAKILAGSPTEPGAEAADAVRRAFSHGGIALTPNQVARIYANLTDQTLGVVLSATPKDSIALTYVSEGQHIRFDEASPGQQASALLRLLLRQVAGTLIIDQPEDDLDNRVMMQIVELIRTSKTRRQLIFATHNPNLVVNGDADKIVTMVATVPEDRAGTAAARIRVEVDGAIETPKVREAITRIMEGGLQAFDLRARKYGLEATG